MGQPGAQFGGEVFKFWGGRGWDASEEVVRAGDPHNPLGFGCRDQVAFQDALRGELIVIARDEQLGDDAAVGQKGVAVIPASGTDRQADPDEASEAGIAAAGTQANVGPEAEAGEKERLMRVACREPVEGGADVLDFATTLVVSALTEAGSPEVEAQDGQPERGEGLGRVVDDLVVHGTAPERMGMGDQGGEWSVRGTCVEEGFQAAGRAAQVFNRQEFGTVAWGRHRR